MTKEAVFFIYEVCGRYLLQIAYKQVVIMAANIRTLKISKTPQNPVKQNSKNRVQQIAEKSTKLFIKKGFAQSSMREISQATGMNLGNIYNYIERKEDILRVFFDRLYGSDQWMGGECIQSDDPVVELRTAVNRGLAYTCRNRQEIALMYREFKSLPKKAAQRVIQRERDFISFFEGIIKRGLEKGAFEVEDPFLTANMIIYQISILPLRSWNLKEYSDQERLRLIENYIVKPILKFGLAKNPGRETRDDHPRRWFEGP